MNWKNAVQKSFHKLGYTLYPNRSINGYSAHPPYSYYTYSPWKEQWFRDLYVKIKEHTVVSEDRCYIINSFLRQSLNLEGDIAECGVYKGGTAFLIAHTIAENSQQRKSMHLFDTFAGMPSTADGDAGRHREGDFGDVSLVAIQEYLRDYRFIDFHPGYIPDTFMDVRDKNYAFVHVDVDLYQTAKDCCTFLYERMVPGGVMIFDDYGFLRYRLAMKQAVDEFFYDKVETPICLDTGQGIVIKV